MKYLRQLLRNVSIRSRLLFGFMILPLVVMLICFLMYYDFSMKMILEKNAELSSNSVNSMEEILHLNMRRLENQLIDFSTQDIVYELIDQPSKEVKKAFEVYANLNKNVHAFCIFDEDKNLVYTKNIEIEKKTLDFTMKEDMTWQYVKNKEGIYLIRRITDNQHTVGYICEKFIEEELSPSFTSVSDTSNMMIVVDQKNQYVFGQSFFDKGIQIDDQEQFIEVNGKSYYYKSKPIEGVEWKVVNLVSSDYVLQEVHSTRNMLFLYGVFILVLEAILSTIVYHSIYDPISNVLVSMRKVGNSNLSKYQVEDDGKDEVHELSVNFNELLNRVEELVQTVQMEQEQKRETQLQLLQAQINPHFLFNTLNTLHSLAILNDDKPLSEGVSALSKLLRNTIVDSKEYVTVQEEIENVKNYIVIQKLRYGNLFETVYNIDEEVKDCKIMKFILQPIVENSILHAFDEDKENQILTIRAQRVEDCLRIEIGDNGKGFKRRDANHSHNKLSGIGIANIEDRIRLMYGDKYSMTIESEINVGTIVTLLLPYEKGASLHV